MDILAKLFGGANRVKILRLFLQNQDGVFTTAEVARRSQVHSLSARREIGILRQIAFLRPRKTALPSVTKKVSGWQLNTAFPFISHLRSLLKIDLVHRKRHEIASRFQRSGRIKLLVVAGIFIQDDDSRADLLIVGDHLKRGSITKAVSAIEADIGRELNYAVFETDDFLYRFNAYDKFVRDILDYPHEKIIDKLNARLSTVSPQTAA